MEEVNTTTKKFVPALGYHVLTPVYELVVKIFCRDKHVKEIVLQKIHGQDLHILDVACGPGELIKQIATQQECCRVVGQDIDPSMVKQAKKKTKELANISVLQGDCTEMSHPDGQFDIVIESLLLHHLSDQNKRKAVKEFHRVLNSTGVFYFVDWVKPQTASSKIGFNIIKILDGTSNVKAHETNEVIQIITSESFELAEPPTYIETSVGTIAVMLFRKARSDTRVSSTFYSNK